jgi:cytochrome oxidase assembly protein ShyY1
MKIQVRILPLITLLVLAALFASLGSWQLNRKSDKEELLSQFEQAPELSLEQALKHNHNFSRVQVLGHYETAWHILWDNKIWKGRPGVHALSLFYSKQGIPLLVDRGWLAMSPDRRQLPTVPTNGEQMVISGLLSKLPTGGVVLGEPDIIGDLEGSVLVTYLDIDSISRATGLDIAPQVLKLDASQSSGFEDREWVPAVILPAQHQAYAVQWFALSLVAIILVFTMAIRFQRNSQ